MVAHHRSSRTISIRHPSPELTQIFEDMGVHERRLKKAMADAGLSYGQLARMMNLSPNGLYEKRRGNIRWLSGEIAQLGKLLGVDSSWLFTNLPTDHWRPRLRSECIDAPRPCRFVGCQFHLYIDVNADGGIVLNFPGKRLEDLEETCALDVAEQGEHTLDEVGKYLNLTRERIRQIETGAMFNFPNDMQEYVNPNHRVGNG